MPLFSTLAKQGVSCMLCAWLCAIVHERRAIWSFVRPFKGFSVFEPSYEVTKIHPGPDYLHQHGNFGF